MILVILGAGASFDSYAARPPGTAWIHEDVRPPLAEDLFSNFKFAEALSKFPDCYPIVPYLQAIPKGQTIEQMLEKLEQEAQTYPQRKKQMAAIRYYLHYMIWECETDWKKKATSGITNYFTELCTWWLRGLCFKLVKPLSGILIFPAGF